jgi:hypothetical protein
MSDQHKVIPWSEKAELFFKQMSKGLQDLMLNIDAFFVDEKKVIEHINSGKRFISFKEE